MDDEGGLDVCLVVPPFDEIRFPPLGSSILASACRAKGLNVRVVYGSILLASRLGHERYDSVCKASWGKLQGEQLFVPYAYPPETLATVGIASPLSEPLQALFDAIAREIAPFLQELTAEVVALRPRIVGISTNFQQNLAAAALARLIREKLPQACIVFGGANVASPMGEGLSQVFPWVDYFFSGEADVEFPEFCVGYVRDRRRPPARIVECAPIRDMSTVHAPDFVDYFAALRAQQERGLLPRTLPEQLTMESSRGCWWGEKHHCTFCGLNGDGMEYRRKDADRVFDELKTLTATWNVKRFAVADNIMPLSFLRDLLPALAQWKGHPRLFYEVKANLREDQLQTMLSAGIDTIQPGIESFSSHVLRLMRKGITGPQNLVLLRTCRSLGIGVGWNYLFGFPGERLEDYEDALVLIPKIEHLDPPTGCNGLQIDRYSPYFNTPAQFGIKEVLPHKNYAALYPRTAPLSNIVYRFIGRYSTPLLANKTLLSDLRAAIALWREQSTPERRPVLVAVDEGKDGVKITDTRRIAKDRTTAISPALDETLRYFERPKVVDRLEGVVAEQVEYLLDRHFIIKHEGQLLSVVTRLQTALALSKRRPEAAVELAAG